MFVTKDSTYCCFSEQGETQLPSNDEINDIILSEIEPVIFLDSCVCLHIINVVDYGRNAKNIDLGKIIGLKEYLAKHPNIKISPFFALLELCGKDAALDETKLWDFKSRIDFFEQIPVKVFKRFTYDYTRDYLTLNRSGKLNNPYKAIEPLLKNSYCALLKIRSLAIKSLTKATAEKNLNCFLDWMVEELDSVRAIEYKLAMNIFGGNTVFRKMIGLDSKHSEIRKVLLGTCWDIFHSKHTANSFRLFNMLQRNIRPFFLTSDANLFNIFRQFSLTLIKDGGDNFVSSFILNSDFSIPHLDNDFVDRQNEKMMNIFVDRRNLVYNFDEIKVNELIINLEKENGVCL
jgi:hypothetical protein